MLPSARQGSTSFVLRIGLLSKYGCVAQALIRVDSVVAHTRTHSPYFGKFSRRWQLCVILSPSPLPIYLCLYGLLAVPCPLIWTRARFTGQTWTSCGLTGLPDPPDLNLTIRAACIYIGIISKSASLRHIELGIKAQSIILIFYLFSRITGVLLSTINIISYTMYPWDFCGKCRNCAWGTLLGRSSWFIVINSWRRS